MVVSIPKFSMYGIVSYIWCKFMFFFVGKIFQSSGASGNIV